MKLRPVVALGLFLSSVALAPCFATIPIGGGDPEPPACSGGCKTIVSNAGGTWTKQCVSSDRDPCAGENCSCSFKITGWDPANHVFITVCTCGEVIVA